MEWIYSNNNSDSARFALGERGESILGCLGINPSTARPCEPDNTLKSVKRIASFNGFDGWVMYNLYPQRATNPEQLDGNMDNRLHQRNLKIIKESIRDLNISALWLAYGNLIDSRNYLPFCLRGIYNNLAGLKIQIKIVEKLTSKGHPRHPLYCAGISRLVDFDLPGYMAGNSSNSIKYR